jgi:hypothetical protein
MIGPRSLMVTAALLLGTTLPMALPGAGMETARAGSEAEPAVVTQHDAHVSLADQFFHVEWSSGIVERGQSRIVGYVYNDSRQDAVNVQLKISVIDESGRPVASVVETVGDTVPARGRAFFDVRVQGNGPSYRVAVASFDFMADGEWQTLTTQQLLTAAGFHKKVADTPEKRAHLETLTPARRLVAHRRDGQLYYVYADPATCKCMYVGTAAQYQLALEKGMEKQRLVALQQHVYDDPVIWTLWEPWPAF